MSAYILASYKGSEINLRIAMLSKVLTEALQVPASLRNCTKALLGVRARAYTGPGTGSPQSLYGQGSSCSSARHWPSPSPRGSRQPSPARPGPAASLGAVNVRLARGSPAASFPQHFRHRAVLLPGPEVCGIPKPKHRPATPQSYGGANPALSPAPSWCVAPRPRQHFAVLPLQ